MDRFDGHASGLDAPAAHGFEITPDDATDLPEITRAIYVGGGGTLVARLQSGAELIFAGVPSGSILPIRTVRVTTAGTATSLVGLS
jgi:hypothetical protein